MDEIDETTKKRVELGWKCILDQYFEHTKKISLEEGPGVSIFKFLRSPEKDGSNCKYLFSEEGGYMWKDLIESSPEGKKMQELYDPVSTVLICVHVPLGESGDGTIGNLKLFDKDTKTEISDGGSSDKTLKIAEELNENLGLHKRNVGNSS